MPYNPSMPTQDLTTIEAAEKLGVTERTIRNWIEEGAIHAYKLNPKSKSQYRIPHSEITRILAERKNPSGKQSGKR